MPAIELGTDPATGHYEVGYLNRAFAVYTQSADTANVECGLASTVSAIERMGYVQWADVATTFAGHTYDSVYIVFAPSTSSALVDLKVMGVDAYAGLDISNIGAPQSVYEAIRDGTEWGVTRLTQAQVTGGQYNAIKLNATGLAAFQAAVDGSDPFHVGFKTSDHTIEALWAIGRADTVIIVANYGGNETRYRVPGGSGAWSDTDGWSFQSGGSGIMPVPTSSEHVVLDANSDDVTLDTADAPCNNFTATSYTGTLSHSGTGSLDISGSLALGAGMTITCTPTWDMVATSGTKTINSAGLTLPMALRMSGPGGTFNLAAAITFNSLRNLIVADGTFGTANFAVTAAGLSTLTGGAKVLNLGSSVITLTGTGTVVSIGDGADVTMNAGTSTIKITDASSSSKTFSGAGKTYNNVWFTGSGTGDFIIVGDNTFADFKVDTPPHEIQFTAGSTTTVATFTVTGTIGNVMTLLSTSPGTAFNIVKSGGGTITCDYMHITDSAASPASTWFATNSTDNGGNTGWDFGDESATGSRAWGARPAYTTSRFLRIVRI